MLEGCPCPGAWVCVRARACVRERVCVRELVGLTLILSIRALFRF